jgi:hypothetical protein
MDTALREKHDELLTQLYNEEALLKEMLSTEQDPGAIEITQIKERIKTLEEELNKVRVEMYYL